MSAPLEISLKDKLLFIESLLIPAFDPDYELDTSKKRKEWMRQRANNTNWDAVISAELIIRYGRLIVWRKRRGSSRRRRDCWRRRKRTSESKVKQASSGFHSSFFALFFSFPVCYHLVFSHVVNLALLSSLIVLQVLGLRLEVMELASTILTATTFTTFGAP